MSGYWRLLVQALVLLAMACAACAKLEVIDLRQDGRQLLAANECAAKGQDGSCNGCVCCCYDGGAGIVSYQPTQTCTCARVVKSTQIWATVVLSIVMVLGSLLVQLYFGGSLPRSPFPNQQQRQRSGRSVVPAPTLPAATQ